MPACGRCEQGARLADVDLAKESGAFQGDVPRYRLDQDHCHKEPATGPMCPQIKSPLLRNSTLPIYQHVSLARWQDTRNPPRRSTVCGRLIPRSAGTSEQTRSKHGCRMV
jgi:hypothetical protein